MPHLLPILNPSATDSWARFPAPSALRQCPGVLKVSQCSVNTGSYPSLLKKLLYSMTLSPFPNVLSGSWHCSQWLASTGFIFADPSMDMSAVNSETADLGVVSDQWSPFCSSVCVRWMRTTRYQHSVTVDQTGPSFSSELPSLWLEPYEMVILLLEGKKKRN